MVLTSNSYFKIDSLHLPKCPKWKVIFYFKVDTTFGYNLTYNSAKLSGRRERYNKRKHKKPYMAKKATESGTQQRKIKY